MTLGAGGTLTLAGVCGDVFVFKSSYVFLRFSSLILFIAKSCNLLPLSSQRSNEFCICI